METEGLERRVRVCLSQAVAAASPVLLEPVMRVEVQSRAARLIRRLGLGVTGRRPTPLGADRRAAPRRSAQRADWRPLSPRCGSRARVFRPALEKAHAHAHVHVRRHPTARVLLVALMLTRRSDCTARDRLFTLTVSSP